MNASRHVWWIWRYGQSMAREYWAGDGWTLNSRTARYFVSRSAVDKAVAVLDPPPRSSVYVTGGRRVFYDPSIPTWYLMCIHPDGMLFVFHETLRFANVVNVVNWYERAVRFTTKASAINRANREAQRSGHLPNRVFKVVDQAEIDAFRVGLTLAAD